MMIPSQPGVATCPKRQARRELAVSWCGVVRPLQLARAPQERGRQAAESVSAQSLRKLDTRLGEDAMDQIPLTFLTDLLGSGKTTVMNRLLQQPKGMLTLELSKEFGNIGSSTCWAPVAAKTLSCR